MLKVAIVVPTRVISNPSATPLGSMALDTSAPTATPRGGLQVEPSRLSTSRAQRSASGCARGPARARPRVWVKTGTGMGRRADLTAVRSAPAPS